MNFLSNLANSVPVVGHIKGLIHYAAQDFEGGNNAMYQATRTTAVLGAGAAGSLAGPGGAAVAAMYAGALADGVASVVMDEPQGLVKGCKNIADDVKEGKNPVGSVASAGFQMGMDGLGGLGMGGVSSAASQVSGKAVAKGAENVAKSVVKTVGEKTLEKTMQMTGEEVVLTVTKTVTEKAVKKVIETAAVQAEIALVSTHVYMQADESTKEEREKRDRKDRQRRNRERRERDERERREREERERRERVERERREERQQQEQRAREQQEQRAREQQEQRAREQQEQRAREQQEQRAREQQEQRAREQKEQRARQQREQQEQRVREQLQQRVREQVEQRSTREENSGSSQPPQGNRNNNNQSGKNKPNYFVIFKNLLKEILNVVFGVEKPYTRARACISRIFQKLSKAQKDYLGKIIKRLYDGGILVEVLILVISMFSEHFPEDISFTNFLSLTEFVEVYIKEEIDYRTVVFRMAEQISRENDSSIPKEEPENLTANIVSTIMNLPDIVSIIVDIFVRLRVEIESELMPFEISEILLVARDLSSNFRDIFSAIYHYFKHRSVPGDGVLSVREYYDWIRRVLEKLGSQQLYRDLLQVRSTEDVRAIVRFEMYVAVFGRRIRIIVRLEGDTIVLASCYVIDDTTDGDEEGMVWIDIHRL